MTHCIASTNQSQSEDKIELKEMKSMIQSLTDTVQKLESKVNSQTSNSTNTRGRDKTNSSCYLTIDEMHLKIDLTIEIMIRAKNIKIHIGNQVTLDIISTILH